MIRTEAACAALLAAVIIACGCSKPAAQDQPRQSPSAILAEADQDKIILAVSAAVRKNHLTDREDECISYRFDDSRYPDSYAVDVLENHRYAKCGGDPNTAPRLFTVKVAKSDHAMSTDQGSASGEFHGIQN